MLKNSISKSEKTRFKIQKIDNSILEIFGMMIIDFQVKGKVYKSWYY